MVQLRMISGSNHNVLKWDVTVVTMKKLGSQVLGMVKPNLTNHEMRKVLIQT